jgi:hypothetical protein
MPHVVPTQVSSFIRGEFGPALGQDGYQVDPQFAGSVRALIRLVDEIPNDLIVLRGDNYNTFVKSVEVLRNAMTMWSGNVRTEALFHAKLGTAIRHLYGSLSGLVDQQVPTSTATLLFITDTDLRESIRQDVAFATQALRDGEWKGATVLAGAVVEALLLWAISEHPDVGVKKSVSDLKKAGKIKSGLSSDPNDWTLETYKLVAVGLGIIEKETIKLVELTQSFRNLIHPGKAIRTKARCDQSTAHAAVAAVVRLVADFTPP